MLMWYHLQMHERGKLEMQMHMTCVWSGTFHLCHLAVEAFATGSRFLIAKKCVCLLACPLRSSCSLDLLQVNVKLEPRIVDPFYFRSLEVTLIPCCGTDSAGLKFGSLARAMKSGSSNGFLLA